MNQWISVEDDIPHNDDNVIVYTNIGEQFGAIYWVGDMLEDGSRERTWVDSFAFRDIETDDHPTFDAMIKVTHWKWLDDAPK